jgi:hypothetical protein
VQFTQIVISDEQAAQLATVADQTLQRAEELGIVFEEGEEEGLQRLAVFMAAVASNPHHFPVTGRMATKIKTATRRAAADGAKLGNDGVPEGVPVATSPRKERQARRIRTSKARRSMRREQAEAFNQAREIMEAEQLEAQQAHEEMLAELEGQPTFDVIGPDGQPILQGVPASFIRPTTELPAELEAKGYQPSEIILPAGVEKQLEREAA